MAVIWYRFRAGARNAHDGGQIVDAIVGAEADCAAEAGQLGGVYSGDGARAYAALGADERDDGGTGHGGLLCGVARRVVGDARRKARPEPTLTVGWVQSGHAGAAALGALRGGAG